MFDYEGVFSRYLAKVNADLAERRRRAQSNLTRRGIYGGTEYGKLDTEFANESRGAQEAGQAFLNEQRFAQEQVRAGQERRQREEGDLAARKYREEGAAAYEAQRARETEAQEARQEFYRTGDENLLRHPQDWQAAWKRKLRGG